MKKLTTEEFIEKARKVHVDKYDYSKVEYVNNLTKVCIICPKHGEFWQTPNNHLSGKGCPICKKDCISRAQKKAKIYKRTNVELKGVNDADTSSCGLCYNIWRGIIRRCCSKKYKKIHKAYNDVEICKEWLIFSNFKKWFDENYIEGFDLDKDLLSNGCKLYSPSTCCFIPREINVSICINKKNRDLPVGVCKTNSGKYRSFINVNKKTTSLGTFDSALDAFCKYKIEKQKQIYQLAKKWEKSIDSKVYNALVNFEIN